MCIIVVKPTGQALPSWDILENCFLNNPDGAGFMYSTSGEVQIEKGFTTFKKLKKAIEALKIDTTDTSMVFHFRIGTSGGNTPENTHPFPVTENISAMRKLKMHTNLGVAHNGVIDVLPRKKDISDTMEYIASQLAPLYQLQRDFYKMKAGKKLIYNATMSKLAFLDSAGKIETIGKFETVDGILYSNTSYLPRIYYRGWDIWDEYQEDLDRKGTEILSLMWLADEDGYVVDQSGNLQEADFYLIDSAGKLYQYDYEYDLAVECQQAYAYRHQGGSITYDTDRAEYFPVAHSK